MDLFGLDKAAKHPEGLLLLTTVYDNVELAIIRSILEGAEIPYLIKERGAGSSVKIIMGYSTCGTDIFVRKEDLDTAAELIAPDEEGEDIPDGGTQDENNGDTDGAGDTDDTDEADEADEDGGNAGGDKNSK